MSRGASSSTSSKVALFLCVCFAVDAAAALLSDSLLQRHRDAAAQLSQLLMMASPAFAGIVCALLYERGRVARALGLRFSPNPGWLLAYVAGIVFSSIAVGSTILLGGGTFYPPQNVQSFALSWLLINPAVQIILATLTEELGWRGYLYDLCRQFGFWPYSLGTGLIWGIWHVPGIVLLNLNYPGHPWAGAAFFVLYCTLLAPLLTLARDFGNSVFAAGIFHGVVNATDLASTLMVKSESAQWQGDAGLGGLIAVAFFLLLTAAARCKVRWDG